MVDRPDRLQVLHLDHTVEAGGAELALLRLVKEARDWNPRVLLPKQAPQTGLGVFAQADPTVAVHTVGPIQTPGVSSRKSPRSILRFARQLIGQAWAIRRSDDFHEAAVVHANTSRSSLYGALACLGTDKKLVLHLRDHVSPESMGSAGFWAYRLVALSRANALIGNSRSTLATALRHVQSRPLYTSVIPSPIGDQFFQVPLSPPSQVSERGLKIGMIARIDPWKGQSLLLEAFADAFSTGTHELYFAGGTLFGHDNYLQELKNDVARLGLEGRVHFLGHVAEVSGVISDFDVCVQASVRPEPLGQNVLQYLAAGKAVIASNEGGPTEWINHGVNGLLFEARDMKSLSAALSRVSNEPGLFGRLQSCARSTEGLMLDKQVAAEHYRVFRDLMELKTRSEPGLREGSL